MGIYVQKMAKNDGHNLRGADKSSKYRSRKLRKGGGRETNYCQCPQGAKTRENGGVGGHAKRGI